MEGEGGLWEGGGENANGEGGNKRTGAKQTFWGSPDEGKRGQREPLGWNMEMYRTLSTVTHVWIGLGNTGIESRETVRGWLKMKSRWLL